MKEPMRVLFFLFVLGLLSKNHLVACASGLILSLSVSKIVNISSNWQNVFFDAGLVFLIIGILLPLASGDISIEIIYRRIFSLEGLIATIVGICSAVLARKGVNLLKLSPEVMVGLIFGSILGTSFFNGVPTGPLVAAGIAALFIEIARFFK
ncbi:MAG: DUF441 domain-containing protein [Firmicutes bacterium]|nr:DUF441 domain-containing protein [Bacillota bacterium]